MQKSLWVISLIILLSACSPPPEGDAYHQSASSDASMAAESMTTQASVLEGSDEQNPTNPTLNSQATTQGEQAHLTNKAFVIKADVQFAVKDVVATKDSLEALALQTGGYIQTSNIYNETTDTHRYPIGGERLKVLTHFVRHGQMTVRIPKARVGEFLKGVQGQVVFLNNQSFNASDVALDLQRQALHAQIEAEKQKQLNNLDATKTDDLGDKSAHVGSIAESKYRETLAHLDRQALAEQVAFSTISLAFYQNPQIFESVMPDTDAYIAKDERANFTHRLSQSLGQGWLYFLEFILWLTSLWAFILGVLVLVVLWKKGLKPFWHRPFRMKTKSIKKPNDSSSGASNDDGSNGDGGD